MTPEERTKYESSTNWARKALFLMNDVESAIAFCSTHMPREKYELSSKAFWNVCQMLADEDRQISDNEKSSAEYENAQERIAKLEAKVNELWLGILISMALTIALALIK